MVRQKRRLRVQLAEIKRPNKWNETICFDNMKEEFLCFQLITLPLDFPLCIYKEGISLFDRPGYFF